MDQADDDPALVTLALMARAYRSCTRSGGYALPALAVAALMPLPVDGMIVSARAMLLADGVGQPLLCRLGRVPQA